MGSGTPGTQLWPLPTGWLSWGRHTSLLSGPGRSSREWPGGSPRQQVEAVKSALSARMLSQAELGCQVWRRSLPLPRSRARGGRPCSRVRGLGGPGGGGQQGGHCSVRGLVSRACPAPDPLGASALGARWRLGYRGPGLPRALPRGGAAGTRWAVSTVASGCLVCPRAHALCLDSQRDPAHK